MFRTFQKPTFLLLGLLIFPTLLLGQDPSKGTITGVVRDSSGGAVTNATVDLRSLFGDRSTKTGPNGEYTFVNLPAGSGYAIRVSQEGFQPASIPDVVVQANRQTSLDVTLQARGTAQTVKPDIPQPDIDFASTATGAQLGDSLFQRVPVERNVSAIVAMAPGVSDGARTGAANPSITGGTGLQNQYLVNGADATNRGYGSFGPTNSGLGSPGSGVNFDFIKEAQVITSGAEARYGQSLGGTVNLVTKSGDNAFHGTLYSYFQPREFETARPDANRLTTTQHARIVNEGRYDFGGDLGGYLIRNKLFFYGGLNPQFGRSYRTAPSTFANSRLGEVPVKSRSFNYTAKLNWNLSPKHQFEASVFGDPSAMPMGFTRVNALAADNDLLSSSLDFGSRIWTARYTGDWTPNWLFTANFSQYFSEFRETPKFDGYQVIDNTALQRGTGGQVIRGGLGQLENAESRGNQFAWSSTYRGTLGGSHAISFGYQFDSLDFDRNLRFTGAQFTLPNLAEFGSAAGRTQYGAALMRRYLNPADPSSPVVLEVWGGNYSNPSTTGWTRYHAAYLEDSWTIGRRLTIRPGLRWEKQRISGPSVNPSFGDNWAPRIGVIFDPTADRQSKVFFNWGRFYERIPGILAARFASNEWTVRGALYRDQSGTIDLSPANYIGNASGQTLRFTSGPSVPMLIAGDPKPTYQDEIVAGYERDLGRSLTFSGRFVWRDLRGALEDVSPLSMTDYDAGRTQQLVLANPSANLRVFGPDARFYDPERTYKAMELVANKRFGTNWQTFASYRLSKLSGNYEGLYRSDMGLLTPYASTSFDFTNSDGRLLDQARTGDLPLDRTHNLKLFGSYQFDTGWLRNFSVGGAWNIASGTPISRYMANPAYNLPGDLLSGSRGALGRTDWTYPVDFHADYTCKVAEGKNLKFVADFFNLFNQKRLVRVDQNFQLDKFTANPDFLKPNTLNYAYPYQVPFHARLGVRFEF